jgi:hypothetical protein
VSHIDVRHLVISRRARGSRRHTFLGASRTEEGGGAGASTQRESSGAALVGEGASRSSPARACATTVARLPAVPTRAVRESPRRSARAGTTPPREAASDDMARARGGTRERGVRCCARTTRSRTKARRGCDGRGPRGKRAQSKVASHFSRCVSACLPENAALSRTETGPNLRRVLGSRLEKSPVKCAHANLEFLLPTQQIKRTERSYGNAKKSSKFFPSKKRDLCKAGRLSVHSRPRTVGTKRAKIKCRTFHICFRLTKTVARTVFLGFAARHPSHSRPIAHRSRFTTRFTTRLC